MSNDLRCFFLGIKQNTLDLKFEGFFFANCLEVAEVISDAQTQRPQKDGEYDT